MLKSKNEIMTIEEYKILFEDVINKKQTNYPYDNPAYVNYVKLNKSRSNRWVKRGEISEEVKNLVENIHTTQNWILITEPWCGDAANLVPIIEKIANLNPHIKLKIQLRDSGSEIDNYLTNESKSIPKLIVRDNIGNDLFTWGARPKGAQDLFIQQKELDLSKDEKYMNLLRWYIKDNATSIQEELYKLLQSIQ